MRTGNGVAVMLCVNDPANGMFTGRVCGVEILDDEGVFAELELETGFWYDSENPTCDIDPAKNKLRIGRRVWPISGWHPHVGNWCWDQVWMRPKHARELIAHCVKRGFTITMAHDDSEYLPAESRGSSVLEDTR